MNLPRRGRLRILVPISHQLHFRNLVQSGAVAALEKRGHEVIVHKIRESEHRWARLRRSLRLMSMVQGELLSATYKHKATLRTGGQKYEAAVWRALRRSGVDLEDLAIRIEAALPTDHYWRAYLETLDPDLVLWGTLVHQDATDNSLIKEAKRLSIPVVAQVASWDNLTTKSVFLVRPDRLIVWGETQKRHAVEIHGFDPAHVAPTGPPHFTPYESGVQPLGKQILVAGTSLHYWAEEKAFVAELQKSYPDRVLHRLHPRTSGKGWEMPIDGPYRDLAQSGVAVAAFSTIIIEAALMGRPSILVAFGTGEQGRLVEHTKYDHMRDVAGWSGVMTARSYNDIEAWIAVLLREDDGYQMSRRRAQALQIANAEPGILDRFCDAVEAAR